MEIVKPPWIGRIRRGETWGPGVAKLLQQEIPWPPEVFFLSGSLNIKGNAFRFYEGFSNQEVVDMIPDQHGRIMKKIEELYEELFSHDGYGHMELDMRFLKKGQKEIIIRCGKDYRYVVDFTPPAESLPRVTRRVVD